MGINHRNMGQYFESVFRFGKAVELFEKPAAYNNCGLSNFENENYPQAATDFNNAIKKSLNKPVAAHFNNLGLACYFQENKQFEAMDAFAQAISIGDQNRERDPNVYYNRGNVYLNMNQFFEARNDFDSAISIQSTNPKFYHAKGLAYETEARMLEQELKSQPPEEDEDEADDLILGNEESKSITPSFTRAMTAAEK